MRSDDRYDLISLEKTLRQLKTEKVRTASNLIWFG